MAMLVWPLRKTLWKFNTITCWEVLAFRQFLKVVLLTKYVNPEDTRDLVWNSRLHINELKRIKIWIIISHNVPSSIKKDAALAF